MQDLASLMRKGRTFQIPGAIPELTACPIAEKKIKLQNIETTNISMWMGRQTRKVKLNAFKVKNKDIDNYKTKHKPL